MKRKGAVELELLSAVRWFSFLESLCLRAREKMAENLARVRRL